MANDAPSRKKAPVLSHAGITIGIAFALVALAYVPTTSQSAQNENAYLAQSPSKTITKGSQSGVYVATSVDLVDAAQDRTLPEGSGSYEIDVTFTYSMTGASDRAKWTHFAVGDRASGPSNTQLLIYNFTSTLWETAASFAYTSTLTSHLAVEFYPFDASHYGSTASTPQVKVRYLSQSQGTSTDLVIDQLALKVYYMTYTAAADPVGSNGAAQAGAKWGTWTAIPGATNVESSNFIKITNSGSVVDVTFTIDFYDDRFRCGADGSWFVPIDGAINGGTGNVQFAGWEDVTGLAAPSAGTYNWGTTRSSGESQTFGLSSLTSVYFVKYRVLQVPSVVKECEYSARVKVVSS